MKAQAISRPAVDAGYRRTVRRQKHKKYLSWGLIVLAFLIMLTSVQATWYYSRYIPRVNGINTKLDTFMGEKTSGAVLADIQEQFMTLLETLRTEETHARQLVSLLELMIKHFRQTPVQTGEEVRLALVKLERELQQQGQTSGNELLTTASKDVAILAARLGELVDIYTIPFDELQSDLESPPWYLWPVGSLIRYKTGYLSAVTFNRAMYLAQIGEAGTARVLLTGLYSSSQNKDMLGMIFYGMGRLQWELFMTTNEPENYFQAVKFVRQSIQEDPEMDLSRRVFDFMMSLPEGDSAAQAGEGDPANPSEGEAASVSEPAPMF
jgi:hypothetical protein